MQKLRLLPLLGFLATSAVFAATPTNAVKFSLGAAETHTPVSGYSGAWTELGNSRSNHALAGIVWGEKTDDPCGMVIATKNINTFEVFPDSRDMPRKKKVNPYVWGKFSIVDGKTSHYETPTSIVRDEIIKLDCNGDKKFVQAIANAQMIHKLNVCTTDKKKSTDNKLKGIKIWLRTLDYDSRGSGGTPKMIDDPTAQSIYHKSHCDKWHKPVACGAGEIATGIRVHHNDIGHRSWATGLSLVCRKVETNGPSLQHKQKL